MILIFHLVKIMHILMKKQGCLICLPHLNLVLVGKFETWTLFLYIHIYIHTSRHGTEHCELKMFWGMRCWKCSVCFSDSPFPNSSRLGGNVLPVAFSWVFMKNSLCFPGKYSRSWFWYWLLSQAVLKSAEAFGISEKKLAHNMSFQGQ